MILQDVFQLVQSRDQSLDPPPICTQQTTPKLGDLDESEPKPHTVMGKSAAVTEADVTDQVAQASQGCGETKEGVHIPNSPDGRLRPAGLTRSGCRQ